MKSTKKLSSAALLSVLALTGCTNSGDTVKNEASPVTAGTQEVPAPVTQTVNEAGQSGSVSPAGNKSEQGEAKKEDVQVRNDANTGSAATVSSGTVQSANQAPASKDIIKTGQVNYKSPAGDDMMRVNITATTDGIIAGVLVTPLSTNTVSLKFQQEFADKVGKDVIGKKLKGLKVDTVSGASLTTAAFNGFLANNSN